MNAFLKRLPILILFFSFLLFCNEIDLSWFNVHMSRDLMRSMNWARFDFSDWLGPEMGWDFKRLPGPFYYMLLAPATWLGSVQAVLIYKVVLIFAGLLLLTQEMNRLFDKKVVAVFLLLFCLAPIHFHSARNLWNPSLIVLANILQFVFFLKYWRTQKPVWILISALAAALAVQVHFSTLTSFTAVAITVMLTTFKREKRHFLLQFLLLAGLAYWLYYWYSSSDTQYVDRYVLQYYGSLNRFWIDRLLDILSCFSFVNYFHNSDYSLYTIFVRYAEYFGFYPYSFWEKIFLVLNIIYTALFAASFFYILRKAVRIKNALDIFLVTYFGIFVLYIMIYSRSPHVPYRYLLAIFPIQFFIISYGVFCIRARLLKYLLPLAAVTFTVYAHLNYKILKFQEFSGRISHSSNDSLELPVRSKLEIYKFITSNSTYIMDPFEELHGRVTNKMRNKELDWNQTDPYFALFKISEKRDFVHNPSMKDALPVKAWHVYFRSKNDIKQNPDISPLVYSPLKLSNLPQNLVISYLDDSGEVLEKVIWKNTSMILPFAFKENLKAVHSVELDFELNGSENRFFNVLYETDKAVKWAPRAFLDHSLALNGNQIKASQEYFGIFPTQTQFIYQLPVLKNGSHKAKLKLLVNPAAMAKRNYYRLDLFGNDFEMHREELFGD